MSGSVDRGVRLFSPATEERVVERRRTEPTGVNPVHNKGEEKTNSRQEIVRLNIALYEQRFEHERKTKRNKR